MGDIVTSPRRLSWLGAWVASSWTNSWAWIFTWGLAWIMHYTAHNVLGELVKMNEEELAGAAPHGLLAGMGAVMGFMMLTGWLLLVWLFSWILGWDARPI